jgi:hypothetical protein
MDLRSDCVESGCRPAAMADLPDRLEKAWDGSAPLTTEQNGAAISSLVKGANGKRRACV